MLQDGLEHEALRAPSGVTSIGALCALVLGALNLAAQHGAQDEAQRHNEKAETRLVEAQRRLWDGIEKERDAREHAREQLRNELLSDIRRELDQRAGDCCRRTR